MLTRRPDSVTGDRQILAERREPSPVDERAAALRASTSSSRSERQTFQLEKTTVQTSAATISTTTRTAKTGCRVLRRVQHLADSRLAYMPCDADRQQEVSSVQRHHAACRTHVPVHVHCNVIPRSHDTTGSQTGCHRLSIRLYNRFENRVERTATVRSTRLSNRIVQPI